MRRILRPAVLSLAALLIAAAPAAAQYPEEPGDGIADLAGVLSSGDAEGIRSALYRMRENPGVEVRVLTVQSVDRYRTGAATPEAFAAGVYNAWKLGYGQAQDGVLVLLSVDDRFTRVELGDGVPAAQDARMRAIVDDVMVPRFRGGDMSGGLRDGVLAIAGAFGTPAPPAPLTPEAPDPAVDPYPQSQPLPAYQLPDPPSPSSYDTPRNPDVMPFVVLLALVAGGLVLVAVVRGARRTCAGCKLEMQALDEQQDDVFLDSGRRLEEVLGSVNYTVWKCPGCGGHEIQRSARWFSGKETCPQCSYKTVNVSTTTLEWPTYDHGGTQRVEKDCAHCHWQDVDTVHLPRKERPAPSSSSRSFSSSSSSRSSGGGSSGGGGGGHSSGRGSSGRW